MSWEFVLKLDPDWRGPLAQQIARAVSDEIQRERLVPGDRLPSTRKLAAQLGVHRKTVVAASFELAREGWITTERARGTYVSRELPAAPSRRSSRWRSPRASSFHRSRFRGPRRLAGRSCCCSAESPSSRSFLESIGRTALANRW